LADWRTFKIARPGEYTSQSCASKPDERIIAPFGVLKLWPIKAPHQKEILSKTQKPETFLKVTPMTVVINNDTVAKLSVDAPAQS